MFFSKKIVKPVIKEFHLVIYDTIVWKKIYKISSYCIVINHTLFNRISVLFTTSISLFDFSSKFQTEKSTAFAGDNILKVPTRSLFSKVPILSASELAS